MQKQRAMVRAHGVTRQNALLPLLFAPYLRGIVPRGTFNGVSSVGAVRAMMRAGRAVHDDRALNAGQGREGEMAYPEDKIGPLVSWNSPADPCNHPFFEVDAGCSY